MAHAAHDLVDAGATGAPAPFPAGPAPAPAPTSFVPTAEPVAIEVEGWASTRLAALGAPVSLVSRPSPIHPRPGCYRLAIHPASGLATFHGTLRVDHHGTSATVSGDLYRYPRIVGAPVTPAAAVPSAIAEVPPLAMSALGRPVRPHGVPAHPLRRYHSYLRATAIRASVGGALTILAEEHRFRAASWDGGSFDAPPRILTIVLEPMPRPPGYTAIYFEGTVHDDGVDAGRVALGWVSPHPRRPGVVGAAPARPNPLSRRDGEPRGEPTVVALPRPVALDPRVRHHLVHLPDIAVPPAA